LYEATLVCGERKMMGMYNCREVSQIVSESLDKRLGFWIRVKLWMHLSMCGLCFRFRKTMFRIDREVKEHSHEIESGQENPQAVLSAESRERIIRRCRHLDG
jgi:hypothetical protein